MRDLFRLHENGTTVKKELLAGLTTFSTMAYILAVNPMILSRTGMDFNALITATALNEDLPLVTADREILNAGIVRTIW